MQFGLFARLALTLGMILTLAMAVLATVLLLDVAEEFRNNQLERATTQVKTLAEASLDALVSEDYELLERWVNAVIPEKFYAYAYLARSNGQILTHSNHIMVGRHLLPKGKPQTLVVEETEYLGRPVTEVTYPVKIDNNHLANAVVAYYRDETLLPQKDTAFTILLFILGSLLVLLTVMLWVIKKYTRPLSRLTDYITRTSLHDNNTRIDSSLLQSWGEVGVLSRAYDAMIQRLQSAFEALSTEEERLKEKVDERTQELLIANQELEKFSYSVSHDLRSPLRIVAGFSDILLEEHQDNLDETGKEYLQLIQDSTIKMEKLIDDMLQLSRISRKELELEEVNLSLIVSEILERHQYSFPDRKAEFVVEENIVCQADRGMMIILMENLLGNACKYTSKKEISRIEFGHEIKDGEIVYYVRDNGAGFDMRYADKLFEAFQRLHSESEFPGSGVGLATVARVISRHKGKIWAESTVGEGAVFYFTL